MKFPSVFANRWKLFVACVCVLTAPAVRAQSVIFETGFESEEGYSTEHDLTGQNGWIGDGADGILDEFFEGMGQQAYIGFAAPEGTNDIFSVYRPVNFTPTAGQNLVKFSVRMQIVDSSSTNGPWDVFRWSVYNTNGTRLFSLDFDNYSRAISYLLEDGRNFIETDFGFDNLGYYDLGIAMNFARNVWTATLNEQIIVNSQPITTGSTPLHLGDVDAVWILFDPQFPGDNYMLFDDYRITAEAAESIAPRLEPLGMGSGGSYRARVYGEPGLPYQIEASTDLVNWQPLLTITAPVDGILEFEDTTASGFQNRYYRARQGL